MFSLLFQPLTASVWEDFVELFGKNGACGGCWCMWWRLQRKEFEIQKGEGNKTAIKKLVDNNESPGILAYLDGKVIGWCAVAPREHYPRMEKSRTLKRIDDKKVWSITCLFIKKEFRRKGMSTEIVKGAVNFSKNMGAKIIEAYPVIPANNNIASVFAWTGLPSTFVNAGFEEVARPSLGRIIMRYYV